MVILSPTTLFSQDIPNGGFENWDTVSYPLYQYPYNWQFLVVNTPCFPVIMPAKRTQDSYEGSLAVVMESTTCFPDLGEERLNEGFISSGNPSLWSPRDWSVEYNARPEQLNFFYKFHREGSDSAYVKILFFNYDSITPGLSFYERIDTIGFNSDYIFEETDEYTLFELPLGYMSEEEHHFMHILFSTSKTLSEHNGSTVPYVDAYPGTKLWVDDVSVSGGTVNVKGVEENGPRLTLYPNPTTGRFRIQMYDGQQIEKISMRDYLGREIKMWKGYREEFWVNELPIGTYLIRIETKEGVIVRKLALI